MPMYIKKVFTLGIYSSAMAEQKREFTYCNIQLYKSENLGSGSYGSVCKAKCDGLLCAAKIMHPTLFDLQDPGADSHLRKFQEEVHILSLARHPNIVQYLATYYDPDTRLPVLLMELCDESLTAFLKRSPRPLCYHIQLNICLDIVLALVYLHSNGLIHRDLTGNNILMMAGTRAKITDFGMSKLTTGNPRMKALTLCPGNLLYMSPEALDDTKSYTAKLDIFSFGVIAIQILTREFPNPTDRYHTAHASQNDEEKNNEDNEHEECEVRVLVPEAERRQAHLQLIPDTHPLKAISLQCLKKESRRPSAIQLSESLSELKQAPQYTESMEIKNKVGDFLSRQIEELQQQNIEKEQLYQQLEQNLQSQIILTEAKASAANEYQAQSIQLHTMIVTMARHLQQKQDAIETKERELQESQYTLAIKQHAIETIERQLQQTHEQLQVSQQLVTESLKQKEKTIRDLQKIISHYEAIISKLKQQDIASNIKPKEPPVMVDKTQRTTVASAAERDISHMIWSEGKKAPEKMFRGAAVVHGSTAYFRPLNSDKVYSYQNISGDEQWTRLPDNPNWNFSLAVIDGLLTSVGGVNCRDGQKGRNYTNTLLSFKEGEKKQWSSVFPPMPTPRSLVVCISTEQALIVAGGDKQDIVEVMDINTKQWMTASPLPQELQSFTGIVYRDSLFLAGGSTEALWSKSVFTCSLPDLLQPEKHGSRMRPVSRSGKRGNQSSVWKEISSLPVTGSTLASCHGHLLAIGGYNDSRTPTTEVYRYDSHTDSWHVISHMKNKRSMCFTVTLPEDLLIVVGGSSNKNSTEYSQCKD